MDFKRYWRILLILNQTVFFLHGRYFGDNIRQVLETTEHNEKSGKPGLVFIADFEKAFDKVRLESVQIP